MFSVFLTLIGLVLLLSLFVHGDVEGATIIHGDVVVDHDVVWFDETIEVHGNVTVMGGKRLTILRSTLEIVGSANGTHWFNASAGSDLTVQNGTIRGSPHHIGIILAGMVHMVDSTLENVWTSDSTPAIDIPGAATLLRTTVQGCPNSTGVMVTGAMEAEECEFQDLGEVSLAFQDPRFPNRSSVGNSSFVSDGEFTGDTVGISIRWSSKTTGTVDLTVDGCTFNGFT